MIGINGFLHTRLLASLNPRTIELEIFKTGCIEYRRSTLSSSFNRRKAGSLEEVAWKWRGFYLVPGWYVWNIIHAGSKAPKVDETPAL
ncbi:hypothetical protein WG66_007541 [Moniliophthora roreri]|nr:hypothetical protein WG66_007541 [Moniliophthora roreri]